jgi:hypothetical protein
VLGVGAVEVGVLKNDSIFKNEAKVLGVEEREKGVHEQLKQLISIPHVRVFVYQAMCGCVLVCGWLRCVIDFQNSFLVARSEKQSKTPRASTKGK